ncbi:SMC-Scp complex subunit ScpB [Hungatella hathewayi]|nr:SMC-Scp complex subunit ScpB [Hungatella hathewayi]
MLIETLEPEGEEEDLDLSELEEDIEGYREDEEEVGAQESLPMEELREITNEEREYEAVIEAVLFTMGNSVEMRQLVAAIGQDEETARSAVKRLQKQYEAGRKGMQIIELENSYQMCTRPEYYENLIRVAATPKKQVLTDVVLETLSIIAYKQPVTKMEIEKIRGVKSDHAVNRLVEYNLVYEVGRLDAPGRPALFATTEEFLRRFGIGSTQNLPTPDPETAAEIRMEVEEELKGSGELLPEDEVLLDEIPIAEMRAGAEEAAVTRQESEAGFTEAGSADNNRNELQPKSADNQEDIQ